MIFYESKPKPRTLSNLVLLQVASDFFFESQQVVIWRTGWEMSLELKHTCEHTVKAAGQYSWRLCIDGHVSQSDADLYHERAFFVKTNA